MHQPRGLFAFTGIQALPDLQRQVAIGQLIAAPIACSNPQIEPGGLHRGIQPKDSKHSRQQSIGCARLGAIRCSPLLRMQLNYSIFNSYPQPRGCTGTYSERSKRLPKECRKRCGQCLRRNRGERNPSKPRHPPRRDSPIRCICKIQCLPYR